MSDDKEPERLDGPKPKRNSKAAAHNVCASFRPGLVVLAPWKGHAWPSVVRSVDARRKACRVKFLPIKREDGAFAKPWRLLTPVHSLGDLTHADPELDADREYQFAVEIVSALLAMGPDQAILVFDNPLPMEVWAAHRDGKRVVYELGGLQIVGHGAPNCVLQAASSTRSLAKELSVTSTASDDATFDSDGALSATQAHFLAEQVGAPGAAASSRHQLTLAFNNSTAKRNNKRRKRNAYDPPAKKLCRQLSLNELLFRDQPQLHLSAHDPTNPLLALTELDHPSVYGLWPVVVEGVDAENGLCTIRALGLSTADSSALLPHLFAFPAAQVDALLSYVHTRPDCSPALNAALAQARDHLRTCGLYDPAQQQPFIAPLESDIELEARKLEQMTLRHDLDDQRRHNGVAALKRRDQLQHKLAIKERADLAQLRKTEAGKTVYVQEEHEPQLTEQELQNVTVNEAWIAPSIPPAPDQQITLAELSADIVIHHFRNVWRGAAHSRRHAAFMQDLMDLRTSYPMCVQMGAQLYGFCSKDTVTALFDLYLGMVKLESKLPKMSTLQMVDYVVSVMLPDALDVALGVRYGAESTAELVQLKNVCQELSLARHKKRFEPELEARVAALLKPVMTLCTQTSASTTHATATNGDPTEPTITPKENADGVAKTAPKPDPKLNLSQDPPNAAIRSESVHPLPTGLSTDALTHSLLQSALHTSLRSPRFPHTARSSAAKTAARNAPSPGAGMPEAKKDGTKTDDQQLKTATDEDRPRTAKETRPNKNRSRTARSRESFRVKCDRLDPPTKEIPVDDLSAKTEPTAAVSQIKSTTIRPKVLNLRALIKRHLLLGARRMVYEPAILYQLLELAKESFVKQEPLIELNAPVNICGDIHGQYSDLMRIFNSCGLPFKARYLFLGDYVDRGKHALEVIVFLMMCKVQFPHNIFLLRGNHELKNINKVYGFYEEIKMRYSADPQTVEDLWLGFNNVFSFMPYAALVSNKILCMHGGISQRLESLNTIRKLQRGRLVLEKNTLEQDLLWADPQKGVDGYTVNKARAVSVCFGERAVKEMLDKLKIDLIIRAHQVVEYGYAFFANRKVITVFSAARYNEDLCNYAAVARVNEKLEVYFTQLKPVEFDQAKREKIAIRTADCDDEAE